MAIRSFYPMNMVVKGTAMNIQTLLNDERWPEYSLDPASTYHPEDVPDDDNVVEAKVIFEMYNCVYMTNANMPGIGQKDVKFLMMGSGGDECRGDGTYAIFKNFGEEKPSVVLHFEKYSNPHMEEFEGQEEVIESVWNSFLDHEWSYSYLDYSCGEDVPYAFKGKKAKELIEKWYLD